MLLIFNLGRPDVLPVHDLGVRKGYQVAYRKRQMQHQNNWTYRARLGTVQVHGCLVFVASGGYAGWWGVVTKVR